MREGIGASTGSRLPCALRLQTSVLAKIRAKGVAGESKEPSAWSGFSFRNKPLGKGT